MPIASHAVFAAAKFESQPAKGHDGTSGYRFRNPGKVETLRFVPGPIQDRPAVSAFSSTSSGASGLASGRLPRFAAEPVRRMSEQHHHVLAHLRERVALHVLAAIRAINPAVAYPLACSENPQQNRAYLNIVWSASAGTFPGARGLRWRCSCGRVAASLSAKRP
jgi:hypothetical protein